MDINPDIQLKKVTNTIETKKIAGDQIKSAVMPIPIPSSSPLGAWGPGAGGKSGLPSPTNFAAAPTQ